MDSKLSIFKDLFGKLSIFKELLGYVVARKRWVIVPLIGFLIVLGFLIIFAESSVLAPIIYTLF